MWEFLKEINRQGTTIILTTHYLEEAENLCRNIAIIDQGRIAENTQMKSLLTQLKREVFVLDVKEPLPEGFSLDGFDCQAIDDNSLEVAIVKGGATLNSVFRQLDEKGVEVSSMRNKANRLEELFVSLLAQAEDAA